MTCRSCGSEDLEQIFDLGRQPWCNDFLTAERVGTEPTYPLELWACKRCELLQLNHTVPKETMFGDHAYLSGVTKTLVEHFRTVAEENKAQFDLQPTDLVVDIGGNDGSQLAQYQKLGLTNVLNVECAKTVSQLARDAGVPTITAYFNREFVDEHLGPKTVKLYNASGVFFHLEELHSVIDGIVHSLRDDGVLVVQFMYAGAMIDGLNFDTIYHEHLCYYTLRSLQNLLRPHGLEVFDAYRTPIHSGSIVAKICKASHPRPTTDRYAVTLKADQKYTLFAFSEFARDVEERKDDLRGFLSGLAEKGNRIFAYGAPAKGNTLLNYFGIDHTLIECATEVNELKIGKFLPGSHIPVVRESKDDVPDYYLLLSHNFADEILAKNRDLLELGVKFIVPFPTPRIVRYGVRIETRAPDAVTSPDYLAPIGAVQDNHSNPVYLAELRRIAARDRFSYLDLGCAGGQSVVDLYEAGHVACGVEGSDLTKMLNGANGVADNWRAYKDRCLFKANIARPFGLVATLSETLQRFDVITAWDVLEHPKPEELPIVLANVVRHLKSDGKFVCLVNTTPCEHHQCVRPREWWVAAFAAAGLEDTGFDFHASPRHTGDPLGPEDFGFVLKLAAS